MPQKKSQWTQKLEQRLLNYKAKGMPASDIAKKLGLSSQTVRRRLNQLEQVTALPDVEPGWCGTVLPDDAAPAPISLLAPEQCRWPLSLGKNPLFCGAPAAPSSSYCAVHHAVSVSRTRDLTVTGYDT